MCGILIVDDHDDIRELVSEGLRACGHEVLAAKDGQEALFWLSAHAERLPCLIILDLMMPVMDGWDFLDSFRREPAWATLPVIVLSSSFRKGSPNPLLKAQAFWSKPIDAQQLENIQQHCPMHHGS